MMELRIPAAGDAVAEVQLTVWNKADGDMVVEGEIIYTIESQKSVLEIEAPCAGKLHIIEQPGKIVSVGHLVGQIG
jgi:pyruvate/2-oxoglutarate dehydrogenase complex dihydrolipoamide acyltransferase (E2) component